MRLQYVLLKRRVSAVVLSAVSVVSSAVVVLVPASDFPTSVDVVLAVTGTVELERFGFAVSRGGTVLARQAGGESNRLSSVDVSCHLADLDM